MRGRTTEERILNVLKTEPQRGMALLLEQYTGIVWKIISQYLENPEDIKECVNETFVRFYFQRDKYDPGRASLPFYLSVIARSTAVSRYRKDSRHRTEALKEEEAAGRRSGMDVCSDRRISGVEARADLERAMKTLRPDEVQIIRMKYYGGMTIQEIADSLHLPYETVKKRHSRSIHKMRRSLLLTLIILILLLLTACTYNVLRYYEIVPDLPEIWRYLTGDGEDGEDITGSVKPLIIPDNGDSGFPSGLPEDNGGENTEDGLPGNGSVDHIGASEAGSEEDGEGTYEMPDISWVENYGVVLDENAEIYTLAEPVSGENTYTTTTITSAVYDGTNLIAMLEMDVKTDAVEAAGIEISRDMGGYLGVCPRFKTLTCGEKSWSSYWWKNPENTMVENMTFVTAFNAEDLSITDGDQMELSLCSRNQINGVELTPGDDVEIGFQMVPAENDGAGTYVYSIDEEHMIVMRPELNDGRLSVSVNPITIGGENLLSASLVYGSIGYMHGAEGAALTVTGEDGTTKTGKCLLWSPFSASQYFEWDFGEAQPGTYTLSIPYYIYKKTVTEEFCLPIDLENGIWDEEEVKIPGGSVAVESLTPVEAEPGGEIVTEDGFRRIVSTCPNARYWILKLRVTSDDSAFPIGFLRLSPETERTGDYDYCTAGFGFGTSSLEVNYGEMTAPEIAAAAKAGEISGPVSGTIEYSVCCCTTEWIPSTFRLTFDEGEGAEHVNYCQAAGAEITFKVP